MPVEVDALRGPLMALDGALDGIREAIEDGNTELALAYRELAVGATEKLNTIHEQMAEPVPV
jgi:hypothetical protein